MTVIFQKFYRVDAACTSDTGGAGLGLAIARVDLFLDAGGRIRFNEVNTIPGFTAHSRYPNMMQAAGLSFEQVISAVVKLAARQ